MQEEALYVLKTKSPEEAFKIFTEVVLLYCFCIKTFPLILFYDTTVYT
jgi:hypothetical protein